jgi:hypothetical protein
VNTNVKNTDYEECRLQKHLLLPHEFDTVSFQKAVDIVSKRSNYEYAGRGKQN